MLLPEITILLALGLIPGPVTIASIFTANKKFVSNFEDMIATYEYFIKHKEEIEELSKEDLNVTSNITNLTSKEFEKSDELQNAQLTDKQITIQLIDEAPLSDLKIILDNYKTSIGLNSEPYFYESKPEEVHQPEETKTPEENEEKTTTYDLNEIDEEHNDEEHNMLFLDNEDYEILAQALAEESKVTPEGEQKQQQNTYKRTRHKRL